MKEKTQKIGIGLLGRGIVGGGVEAWIKEHGTAYNLELKKIAVRNPAKHKDIKHLITIEPQEVIDDPSIQIVVELMGGLNPAGDYIAKALKSGKSVATANKAVIATRMEEIFSIAANNGTDIGFEASVGGGIRIIKSMYSYKGDRINLIKGILNGTTNYILSRMEEGLDFDSALKQAQEKGFAEAEHISDTGGFDTRYKIAILASIGFNRYINPENIPVSGIIDISPIDMDFASKYKADEGGRGFVIKLLGKAQRTKQNTIEIGVGPVMVRKENQLANINDENNAIYVESDYAGGHMYTGKGAGRFATASAVIMDILHLAENIREDRRDTLPKLNSKIALADFGSTSSRGYLRVNLKHTPGSAAEVFKLLGDNGLNIEDSVQRKKFQLQSEGNIFIPDVITLEEAKQTNIQKVLSQINKSKKTHGKAIFIPIES